MTATTSTTNTASTSANADLTTRKELDRSITFEQLCSVFESVLRRKGHKEKTQVFEKFWRSIREGQFFPFMRLTLPQLDKERMTYGLKEIKIAKYYIEILCLNPNSEDAMRLKKWKDPSIGKRSASEATSFSDVIYETLIAKGWRQTAKQQQQAQSSSDIDMKSLTVFEINQLLDELAASPDGVAKKRLLTKLLRATTALEQKWLIRIILKDMRMSIQHNTILGAFHPHAMDIYNVCTDLKEVCVKCENPNYRFNSQSIKLFSAVKPMLAQLADPEKLAEFIDSYSFVEPKYDGERIMIHKDGDQIKYFTRNSKDYTPIYGRKFDSIVLQCIKAQTCILDGEMLVWSNETNSFKEFGHNRTFALSTDNTDKEQFCYMMFDVLLVNGTIVTEHTQEERKRLLARILPQPLPHAIEIVPTTNVATPLDVLRFLDSAIENGEEGVMIKNYNTAYVPGERRAKWLKLKPDHIDGLGETFDLLILGGYYGTKFGRSSISHFLLGVSVPTRKSEDPEIFYTMCKVGSGYTSAELTELQQLLEPHWRPYERGKPLPHFAGWEPQAGEVLDVWLDPKRSRVLEVKAFSITESTKFKTGHTLRFPRVIRIRHDKNWNDALDFNGFTEMLRISRSVGGGGGGRMKRAAEIAAENLKGRAAKRSKKRLGETSAAAANSRAAAAKTNVIAQYQDTDTTGIERESDLFVGFEFLVMNDDSLFSKQSLERLIVKNGGCKVQNPGPKTTHIIAAHTNNVRVRNWIKSCEESNNGIGQNQFSHIDVLHYSYITDCVQSNAVLKLHPKYMLYTSPQTKELFKEQIDRFGDSFREDTDLDSLKKVFAQMRSEVPDLAAFSYRQIHRTDEKYRILQPAAFKTETDDCSASNNNVSCALFRHVHAYVDKYATLNDTNSELTRGPLLFIDLWLGVFGARVKRSITLETTHVILDPNSMERAHSLYRRFGDSVKYVSNEWVTASIAANKCLCESDFEIPIKQSQSPTSANDRTAIRESIDFELIVDERQLIDLDSQQQQPIQSPNSNSTARRDNSSNQPIVIFDSPVGQQPMKSQTPLLKMSGSKSSQTKPTIGSCSGSGGTADEMLQLQELMLLSPPLETRQTNATNGEYDDEEDIYSLQFSPEICAKNSQLLQQSQQQSIAVEKNSSCSNNAVADMMSPMSGLRLQLEFDGDDDDDL